MCLQTPAQYLEFCLGFWVEGLGVSQTDCGERGVCCIKARGPGLFVAYRPRGRFDSCSPISLFLAPISLNDILGRLEFRLDCICDLNRFNPYASPRPARQSQARQTGLKWSCRN